MSYVLYLQVNSLIGECKRFTENDVASISNLVNKLDSLYQSLPGSQSSLQDSLAIGQRSPRLGGQGSPRGGLAGRRSVSVDPQTVVQEPARGQRSHSIDIGGQKPLEEGAGDSRMVMEIRMLHSTLDSRWMAFERDFKRYSTKLDLSLKFHEVLFEVSVVWIT